MNEGYTIFFGQKPYHIVRHLTPELIRLTRAAGTIIVNNADSNTIFKTIRDMEADGTKAVIILTNMVDHYWQIFQKHFSLISAGGGIIFNEQKEMLFIFRRGTWDLPKGKLDKGETIEECAVREVEEETGLKRINLKSWFGNTYHTYKEKGKYFLKTSVWFMMEVAGNQKLIPQIEEDIEEIKWFPIENWNLVKENTFPAIKLILEKVHTL